MSTPDPADFRQDPPQTGDERAMLRGFLAFQRGTLLWKAAELTGEQLAATKVEPSTMSLLGVLRHTAEVERYWYQICLDQRPIELELWTPADWDGDFNLADATRAEQDLAAFKATIQTSDEIVESYPLDHIFKRAGRDSEHSVRWLYLHMIEEYARHNGHADLLRERTDGMTGF
ncbi:DinB family protein [Kribbella sancticallisti]|uniref:DinB family protein n=1 Tax=Kribbella sancticallisti TaxID=460087 RepID=A0ABN2CWF9_9ACTN